MNILDFDLAGISHFTVSPLGLMLRGTLVVRSYMLEFMSFPFPVIQRFTSAPRLCMVRDGKLPRRNMRRESITDEQLKRRSDTRASRTLPASSACTSKRTAR